MILYFSGTGNSRHLAEVIAAETKDTLCDAAALIKAGEHPTFASESPYVFVAPVYAWRFPRVLERWIGTCRFTGNKKAYFVLSCGDSIGAAEKYVKRFAEAQGFAYMGTAEVVMPENYIVMFQAPSEQEETPIIAKGSAKTQELCKQILSEEPLVPKKISFVGRLCSDLVNPLFYRFYIGAKKFHVTAACIACGLCASSCPLNNITVQDGQPIWGRNCTHCMACIANCPTEAIEYGKNTEGKRRYRFPQQGDND